MKKIVLVCGFIAGLIVTTMMVITIALSYRSGDVGGSVYVGYASMILAFSLVFIGIKNYRDKHSGGLISFGKAFKIGFLITLIASTVYVAVWLVDYYFFIPDYMDRYAAVVLKQTQADGATQQELAKTAAELEGYKEMYKNPLMVVLMTYAEILPVGLIVTLISALILKRKQRSQTQLVEVS